MNEDGCLILASLVSVKGYLLRDRRPFLCFKNGLILNSIPLHKIYLHKIQLIFIKLLSFFEQNALIFKDRSSVVQKKKFSLFIIHKADKSLFASY